MKLIPIPIRVASSKTLFLLHTKTSQKMFIHIEMRMSLLKMCLLFLGIQITITWVLILTSEYCMSLSIMFHRWNTASLTPIRSVSMVCNFMITLLEMNSFMLNWMMTWRYLSNLRVLNVLSYCMFWHGEILKHASILIWLVITSGTHNPLILIIFARYLQL